MKPRIKQAPKYDRNRAFAILEREIPNYRYPPTEQNIAAVNKIAKQALWGQFASILSVLVVAVFGVYYFIDENNVIHLLIRFVLHALPLLWIGSVLMVVHFRERDICARILIATWISWREYREKSADDKISN